MQEKLENNILSFFQFQVWFKAVIKTKNHNHVEEVKCWRFALRYHFASCHSNRACRCPKCLGPRRFVIGTKGNCFGQIFCKYLAVLNSFLSLNPSPSSKYNFLIKIFREIAISRPYHFTEKTPEICWKVWCEYSVQRSCKHCFEKRMDFSLRALLYCEKFLKKTPLKCCTSISTTLIIFFQF